MSLDTLLGRPFIDKTPSGLRRITRIRELDPDAAKLANIETSAFLAYGTADKEFTTALLTEQRIEKTSERGATSRLVQVYQELADNALTATTEVVETTTFDGRRVTRTTHLCKSSQAASLRPAIGSGSPVVFQVEVQKVGPVATVGVFAIELTDLGFILSQQDQESNNGKLLTRTIRTIGSAPATPVGYVLAAYATQNTDGYTVYSSTFAKGDGEISRSRDLRFNGMLERITIRHLTASSVSAQPTTDPLTGGILTSEDRSDQDGYRVWTVTWSKASGTALIRDDVETKHNGKLKIYRRSRFNAAPAAPSATIGGTVVEISSGTRLEDGFTVYDYAWAEGRGRIEIETETRYSGALDLVTVRYFEVDDGALPAGVVTSTRISKQDGLDLTTKVYADGSGLISDSRDPANNGRLIIYRRDQLGSAPTAPSATIGGTVIEIDSSERISDGYTVYSKTWAEGIGIVSKGTQPRDDGLMLAAWTIFGAPGAAWATTLAAVGGGPAGVLHKLDYDELDGVIRWQPIWIQNTAGASPLVGTTVAGFEMLSAGNTDYGAVPTVTISGGGGSGATATAVLSGGTTGYITSLTLTDPGSGYISTPQVTIAPDNSDTPVFIAILTGVAVTRERFVQFTYPGRAQAVNIAHPDVANSHALDIHLSPPIDATLIGIEEINYRADSSIGDLTHPLWNPLEWATVFAQYRNLDSNLTPVSRVEGLRGYRAMGGVSAISQVHTVGHLISVMGSVVGYAVSSAAYLKVFGGPDAPDDRTFTLQADTDLAFLGHDGTKYFRRRVIYATIPTQNAIPTMTSVVMIATGITSIATLKAVVTAGAPGVIGGRTNEFRYSWIQGGLVFYKYARPTLRSGALAADTTWGIRPTDYDAGTPKYWHLV